MGEVNYGEMRADFRTALALDIVLICFKQRTEWQRQCIELPLGVRAWVDVLEQAKGIMEVLADQEDEVNDEL